jgi:RNA 3'-phosphate cyclase
LLHIDGAYGEGGGQIVRTAVALSVLTKTPIEIINIRANRPNPGLKPQHFTAIKIIKHICNAKTEGLNIGSSCLIFKPGEIKSGEYRFDIGTAGSIVLVFQACLLSLLKIKNPITLILKGGTDVKWSPSWDYFNNVFVPLIQKIGVSVKTKLIRRGYYPKGGGEAILTLKPIISLNPITLEKKQDFNKIFGIIHLSNLPDHIGLRMRNSAIKTLMKNNLKTSIKLDKTQSPSNGTGITLWSQINNSIIGNTTLGEKGISADTIGEKTALKLIKDIKSGATIDVFAFDQIIPYLTLANSSESSCIVREISSHAKTNIWLVRKFFNDKEILSIEKKEDIYIIKFKVINTNY